MKKLLLICFTGLLLFILASCGNSDEGETENAELTLDEQEVMEFGKEFIEKFYTVSGDEVDPEDPDEMIEYSEDFQTYLTDEEFEDLNNRREFLLPVEAAQKNDETIAVEDMSFENESELDEEEAIDLTFDFTLVFTKENDADEEVEMEGEMTIDASNDELKISRYYDRNFPAEKIEE